MSTSDTLYEEDFVRWSEDQARALRDAARSGTNLPVDWDNVAEEVESLGRSQRSELRSRIRNIIEHLLKLEHSPAINPRRGWIDTIRRERADLELLLEGSPSLKGELGTAVADQSRRAAALAASSLEASGETAPAFLPAGTDAPYSVEQVAGDWFPTAPRA
jgi:hypothetical protein